MTTARPGTAVRARRIRVEGAVQGVGFRPHVHRLARALGLAGTVANGPDGLEVVVQGPAEAVARLERGVVQEPPPGAVIERLAIEDLPPDPRLRAFTIVPSRGAGAGRLAIGPDLATCPACLAELFDPRDRRYRYPFVNCTSCGPRYTITHSLPYDRPNTSMRAFTLCARCRAEYEDPADRRFHAQPNACPVCGPQLAWVDERGAVRGRGEDALQSAVASIRGGRILAVQGVGGFHLVVLAADDDALARLRARKQRGDKAFAVMFPDLATLRAALQDARLDPVEERVLASPAAPIVLVRATRAAGVSPSVAPASADLGVFLPATPLHHLLLRDLGAPIVATSGNRRDEPLAIDPDEARARLAGIADAFLVHDRPIVRPVDDSIVRVVAGEPMLLRRARGFAPLSLRWDALPADGCDLALGPHEKATVAVREGRRIVLSPHIGDLSTSAARALHERAALDLERLVGCAPSRVVCDRHPDYASTLLAERRTDRPVRVQHHAAHVWAVAFERELEGPFLGIAWDGTGYGDDGTVQGGEVFQREGSALRRVGSLQPFPLPGGERAIHEPWRAALGLLLAAFVDELPEVLARAPRSFAETSRAHGVRDPWAACRALAARGGTPCTSVGRLFDAVAALLGLVGVAEYEAEGALRLEREAARADVAATLPYPVMLEPGRAGEPWRLAHRAWLAALADDLSAGADVPHVAARFHATLAHAVLAAARWTDARDVVLSGGCFQNRILLECTCALLAADGRRAHWPRRIPPNDGSVAVGQLVAAALAAASPSSPA